MTLSSQIDGAIASGSTQKEGSSLKAIKLLLPVWGGAYVRQFLELSLPTILAPGNLPALAAEYPCQFQILTSIEDESLIRQHPNFAKLEAVCSASIRAIDHLITARNYSTTITLAYAEAIRATGSQMLETCFFFLVSDYIVADGSLRNVLAKVVEGSNAVLVGNFQVDEEKALPWLRAKLNSESSALSLSPRELMRWSLAHLHPATVANLVDNPLSHNTHTNRLFWRVDADTLLGRFYLMHMIAIRPEVTDFQIGSSCDYSFVPEMCPTGKVSTINDSDQYLVIEMQPTNHESLFLSPGALEVSKLAKSLSEWTTERHRLNAKESVVFHATDTPQCLQQSITKADEFIGQIGKSLCDNPKPHRDHPYWRGAITAFREARGQKLSQTERLWLHQFQSLSSQFIERLRWAIFGQPPRVYPWHPRWPDYKPVLDKLNAFFADRSLSVLAVSEVPTPFTVLLAEQSERFSRLETTFFLKHQAQRYKSLEGKFDYCYLELGEHDLLRIRTLLTRVAPLVKNNGKILLSMSAGGGVNSKFARDFAAEANRMLPESTSVNEIRFVPSARFRQLINQLSTNLNSSFRHQTLIASPFVVLLALPLLVLTCLTNLFTASGTKSSLSSAKITSLNLLLTVNHNQSSGTSTAPELSSHRIVASQSANLESATLKSATREPQYQQCLDVESEIGLTPLGLMTNQVWNDDPRRLTFVLSRYKFVAKMLSGRKNVGELGCGDAFATRIVLQEVEQVTVYDFDPVFIADVNKRNTERWPHAAHVHDILSGPLPVRHDAVYSLDVIEHISRSDEDLYLKNLCDSLDNNGVLIIGSPTIESQAYASPQSKEGHINCKSGNELKELLEKYFHSVFIFSMNDEVVHTGFYPLAHYLFAVCSHKKES